MKFLVHWFYKNERVYFGPYLISALPSVGDEIRKSKREFFVVKRRVWCFDEKSLDQRVNIELEKAK